MEIQKTLENKNNFIKFLKSKGLNEETDYIDKEYKEGTYFKISKRKLLVIYEVVDKEKIKEIKNHFLIDKGLSYCVIVLDKKIIFFRNFGEKKHFLYSERTKNKVSKIDRLKKIDEEGFDYIFQVGKDISAKFYESFKVKRNLLVKHIENDIAPTEKFLISQKIFDRFFFIYFLCHKEVIKFKDGGKISGENLFSRILLDNKNFLENLKKLFHLFNSQEKEILKIKDYEIVGPYLNGGLFRPDVLEQDLEISLKKKDWKNIFDFLNSYHWIIEDVKVTEENEDKILTPEILGHVYERSVVEWEQKGFEKEAEEAAGISERKKKGVYYTPEEITDYISTNTIIPYLLDNLNKDFESFDKLIQKGSKKDWKKSIEILSEIRILDPACGSGAFLIKASEVLYNLKRRLLYKLKENPSFYDLKLEIITDNIYGVDILAGAIEISKLRLWLWLIEDFDESKGKIQALPNIEYNLKVGNSLIGWVNEKLSQMPMNTPLTKEVSGIFQGLIAYAGDGDTKDLEKARKLLKGYKLENYIEAYYILYKIYRRAHGIKAQNLKEILKTIRKSIYKTVTPAFLQHVNNKIKPGHDNKKPPITREEFNEIQPFHWRIDFGHIIKEGGFDIVIGNPPYGQNKLGKTERKYLKKQLECVGKKSEGGTKNLAPVFTEKSTSFLNGKGRLGFIINNSICRVDEFNKFRKFILENTRVYEIVDEGNPFKDVTLEMISLFTMNSPVQGNNYKINIKSKRFGDFKNSVNARNFLEKNRFMLYLDDFYSKILRSSKEEILYGKRGGDMEYKKEKSKEYLIPYLFSGKCVKKYYLDEKYFYWVSKKQKLSKIFLKEKKNEMLITTKIADKFRAYIKPKEYLVGNNVIKIFLKDGYNKKFILAIANSKLMDYLIKKYIINYSELTVAFYNSILKAVPIPKISKSKQKPFIKLVDKILSITKEDDYLENEKKQEKVKKLQEKIDKLVYDLYDLTDEEIKIVEEFNEDG